MTDKTDCINSFFKFTAGCDADHSLSSSAEVKNGGAISLLPYMSSWCGAQ
jgi:hypothetical protein